MPFPRAVWTTALVIGLGAALSGCARSNMTAANPDVHSTEVVPAAPITEGPVLVGGKPMLPSRPIPENLNDSGDHKILVQAIRDADLATTLSQPGPFTVFAPTDEAFNALPPGQLATFRQSTQRDRMTQILANHVVPGRLDLGEMKRLVIAGNGSAQLKTMNGHTLTLYLNGPDNIVVRDEIGTMADIATYDAYQQNGVVHVVDHVLMPH